MAPQPTIVRDSAAGNQGLAGRDTTAGLGFQIGRGRDSLLGTMAGVAAQTHFRPVFHVWHRPAGLMTAGPAFSPAKAASVGTLGQGNPDPETPHSTGTTNGVQHRFPGAWQVSL